MIVITFILLFLEIFLLFECRSTLDIEMTTLPVIEIHVISNSLDYGIVYIWRFTKIVLSKLIKLIDILMDVEWINLLFV